MATFDYVDKTFLILSAASGSASITSFATVIGAPIGILIAGTGFAFPIISKITKKLLKTMRKKKKKQNKTVFLAKSKLNTKEKIITKEPTEANIHHEEVTMIINKEKKYPKLKMSIRMMKSQSDVEEIN